MSHEDLTPDLLLRAYAAGIFPMAESRDDPRVFWVDPTDRGILPLDGFHMSRSLARDLRRGKWHASLNTAFPDVVEHCANRDETWINDTIRELYLSLHAMGAAHSLEVWEGDTLAGGVYGVALGGAFFGESMFSNRRDGSKAALAWLLDHLRRAGFILFDTQFITPHLVSLGAVEVPRNSYRQRLARALPLPVTLTAIELERDPQAVWQRMTQMS